MTARITGGVGLLALALPLLGTAQTVAPTTTPPRFYVGLGGSILTRESFPYFNGFTGNTIVPTLTVGVQLLPRLAVQAGAGYRWDTRHYTYPGRRLDDNGQSQPGNWYETRRDSYLNIPLLLRYTITRNLDRRLAVDVVGGATLRRYSNGYSASFTYDPTQITKSDIYGYDYANTNTYLTLGPSLRYRMGTHFDATADVVIDCFTGQSYGSFSGRLSGDLMLGVRYRFGGR